MAKTLDFNVLNAPTLPLVMRDDGRTEIVVTTPTEGLVEELQSMAPALGQVLQAGDTESTKAVYTLAAKLISCNRSGLQVTADDLRGKYRLNLESLVVFFNVYLDFLNEFMNAKN
jgi:hypothetical protein